MPTDFKNKTVLVTGGNTGIGQKTSELFGMQGANVIVNYLENPQDAEGTKKAIESNHGKALICEADISDLTQVKKMFQVITKEFGSLDVLINNAAVNLPNSLFEITIEDWKKVFEVNLLGTFLCAREAAKMMLEAGQGVIVNIGSTRSLPQCARPTNIDYSASKAAVVNLTSSLAKELAPKIRVNAVSPGYTATRMQMQRSAEYRRRAAQKTPLGKMADQEDIAEAVLFLASDKAKHITGQNLLVDGGYSVNLG